MSQWPPPAAPPPPHPEEDDWSFLTDQFISATSLTPSPSPPAPSSNPFLDPSLGPHPSDSLNSSNPFLTPPPALPHRSVSLSAPAPIPSTTSTAGPHRSASLSLSDPPTVRSAPPVAAPGRSDSLSSDSGYWTPPSEPYRSASSLSFSPSPPSDSVQWGPPPGPQHAGSLPEFSGRVTSDPIFQPAVRAAVDPARPVPLTIRPRPPRESQRGFALKSIVFFPPSHLWAGHESGLRVWNVDRLFDDMPNRKVVRRGDEESAPFVESTRTTAVVSLLVDTGHGVVWSGHIDGRIMAWRADGSSLVDGFMDCIAWDAHQRLPVLSMVLTTYGELWSGSEGGVIKVWSAEAIKECLSLRKEEKHKATFLLDRACLDLRTLVSDGGSCPLPAVDIKLLLSDNSGSTVWCGSSLSFALWDCRTKELLKTISSIDGQVENRFDLSPQDPYSRKEKSRGPTSFFQRSRNAIMGAADTFKRVAVKAAFGDDIRRTEAVSMTAVGTIWAGSANGAISQWDPNGHRLNEFQHNSTSVMCICAHGTRVWVGYSDGTLQIMDLNGKLLASWVAHKSPITKIVVGRTQLFTLAHHGGIRGWSLSSPGPIDSIIRAELAHREAKYKRLKHFKVLTGTWNVGQEKASNDSIRAWLGAAVKEDVELVVVGLQEVDMGAGFLAMAAAKETVGFEGSPSPNGVWWLDAIERVLGRTHFERIGCRQFASLLIAVWARKSLKQYVGDVESATVACGLGRAIANKGGVGFRMRIYGRTMCFVNCHLAAHLEGVIRRNEDFDYIYRSMTFTSAAGTSAGPIFRNANVNPNKKPDLSESDMVVFLGDFNYRLDGITYEEAMALVYQKDFDKLRQRDQLRAEMHGGRVFQGLREGSIKFPATYKFEKYVSGLSGYDSSEKKRIPAWCDRILYRDSRTTSGDQCSLDCPIVSSISLYDSCMEATDSDHKPVKCMLNVDITYVDERVRRQEFGEIISANTKVQSLIEELKIVPEFSVSTNSVNLQNGDTSIIRVVNKNRTEKAVFDICSSDTLSALSEHQHRRGFFPKWLKVNPTSGVINPGQTTEVKIQYGGISSQDFYDGFSGNQQKEENREKTTTLIVKITGNYSTEARTFMVNVSHTGSNRAFSSPNTQYNYSGYRDGFGVYRG